MSRISALPVSDELAMAAASVAVLDELAVGAVHAPVSILSQREEPEQGDTLYSPCRRNAVIRCTWRLDNVYHCVASGADE